MACRIGSSCHRHQSSCKRCSFGHLAKFRAKTMATMGSMRFQYTVLLWTKTNATPMLVHLFCLSANTRPHTNIFFIIMVSRFVYLRSSASLYGHHSRPHDLRAILIHSKRFTSWQMIRSRTPPHTPATNIWYSYSRTKKVLAHTLAAPHAHRT